MSGRYTNAEYYDMLMCLGAADGVVTVARNLYREKFVDGRPPERQRGLPSCRCFTKLPFRLRSHGTFAPPVSGGMISTVPNRVVEKILEIFSKNPSTSVKKVAAQFGLSYNKVSRTLKKANLHFERNTSQGKNLKRRGRPKKCVNGSRSRSVLDKKKCVCCQAAPGSVAVYACDSGANYGQVLQQYLGVTLHIPNSSRKKCKMCERCESFLKDVMVFRDRLAASSHAQPPRDSDSDSHTDSDDVTLSQLKKKRPAVKRKTAYVQGWWTKNDDTDEDECGSWEASSSWDESGNCEDSDDEEPPPPVKRSRVPAVSKPVIEIKEEDLDADIDLVLNTDVYD